MADPQKEEGFTPIANELLDALISFRIPGEARQVLDAIFRKTYGFQKRLDRLSNSQLVTLTKLKKQNVSRSLSKLITNKLVIKTDYKSKDGNELGINKDYTQWIPFVIKTDYKKKKKRLSSKRITPVIGSDDKPSSEAMDTIEKRNLKENMRAGARSGVKVTKKNTDPQTLSEYIKLMKESPMRHIQIIGDYADQVKPDFSTVGEWRVFTTRNLRAANDLAAFSEEKISQAFERLEKNLVSDKNRNGYLTKWTLETLLKYLY